MPLRRALQYVTVLGLLMLFNVPPVSPGDSQEGWISKAEMSMRRSYFGIGVVDGVIYVIGGMTGEEGKELSLAEAYYPSKDMWAIRNPMPTARSSVGSATVRDKVYVLGGMAGTEILSTVEAYDPSSDSWSRRAPMPTSRFGLAAVSIGDRIYAIGGSDSSGQLATVEEYDVGRDVWFPKASMPTARDGLAAVVVDNKIYVLGGRTPEGPTGVIEVYDAQTDAWTRKRSMSVAKDYLAATVVDASIHVIWLDFHEVYDTVRDTWSPSPPEPIRRHALSLVTLGDTVYAIGGCALIGDEFHDVSTNNAFAVKGRTVASSDSPIPLAQALTLGSILAIPLVYVLFLRKRRLVKTLLYV